MSEHPANRIRSPCAQALDDLWKATILKRDPDYGDWKYPGFAYRHIIAEFTAIEAKLAQARESLEVVLRYDIEDAHLLETVRAALAALGGKP